MDTHFGFIKKVSIFGISLSFLAGACTLNYYQNNYSTYSDISFFKVPLGLIGVVGYLFILLTAWFSQKRIKVFGRMIFPAVNYSLILFTFFFTVFLVIKAFKVNIFCPFCILIWVLNMAIFFKTLIYFLEKKFSYNAA